MLAFPLRLCVLYFRVRVSSPYRRSQPGRPGQRDIVDHQRNKKATKHAACLLACCIACPPPGWWRPPTSKNPIHMYMYSTTSFHFSDPRQGSFEQCDSEITVTEKKAYHAHSSLKESFGTPTTPPSLILSLCDENGRWAQPFGVAKSGSEGAKTKSRCQANGLIVPSIVKKKETEEGKLNDGIVNNIRSPIILFPFLEIREMTPRKK